MFLTASLAVEPDGLSWPTDVDRVGRSTIPRPPLLAPHRPKSSTMKTLIAIVYSALIVPSFVLAADWSQWRGPNRDGLVETLPASLADMNVDWSVELPPSYSGPLADADRIYTTATENEETEVAIAYDRVSGEEVWRTSWVGAMKVPFFAAANGSWIRATPVLVDGKLYVAGMLDVLVCLDAATGDEIWRVDFKELMDTPKPAFGYASSPLYHGGMIITQAGGAVVAVDAETGDLKWTALKSDGSMTSGSAFSSPTIFADAPGGPQLLVQTRTTLAGVNPADGDLLWSTDVEAFRGMNILTPTPRTVGDTLQVFTSAYGGQSMMFAIEGGRGEVKTLWTDKSQGYMSSPVVVGDRIVLHLRNQRATCLDWTTGKSLWTSKPHGKYWSMLTDGTTVLALDQTGDLHRLGVNGDELEILESRKVSDAETWAHIGWDGRQLMIRRLDGLDVYSP